MKLLDLVHRLVRNTEWHDYGLPMPVRSITGEVIDKGVFCWRRWDGGWKYKAMTADEADDAASMWAIK